MKKNAAYSDAESRMRMGSCRTREGCSCSINSDEDFEDENVVGRVV
jgi:hypothetical protein